MRRLISVSIAVAISAASFCVSIPAQAGTVDDFIDKAQVSQNAYLSKLTSILSQEGLTCVKFSAPSLPTFADDIEKNTGIFDSYIKDLGVWLDSSITTARAKCVSASPSPSPTPTTSASTSTSAAAYFDKAQVIWVSYQSKIDDFAKYMGCPSSKGPGIPTFVEADDTKNNAIFDSFIKSIDAWFSKTYEVLKSGCSSSSPSPVGTVTDTSSDNSKANSVRSAYQMKVDDYIRSFSCSIKEAAPAIPSFTTNFDENNRIFENYRTLVAEWFTATMTKLQASCPAPKPSISELQSLYTSKAKAIYDQILTNDVQIRKDKGIYCYTATPPPIPDFTMDENNNVVILNNYVALLKEWQIKTIETALIKCSQQTDPLPATREDFIKAFVIIRQNSSSKLATMIDLSKCPLFLETSQPSTPTLSGDFETNKKTAELFLAQMDTWISENFTKWQTCANANRDYQAEAQIHLKGLDEKLKFYISYYKCETFAVSLPTLPAKIDISNFDTTLRQLGMWYEENFQRVQVHCQAINLDYLTMAKKLFSDAKSLLDTYLLKNGCKRTEYSTPPIMPSFKAVPHQNLNDYNIYTAQLKEWQNYNFGRINKYCQTGNDSEAEEQLQPTQKTLCINVIREAKNTTQYTQANIGLISDIYSSSQKLADFVSGKKITYEQANSIYQNWVNQEILKLSTSLKLLADSKGSCADSLIEWSDLYQQIDKYLDALQTLMQKIQFTYKNIYDNLPRLIPEIGKITQIVGGCQVQILNYDPTFNWYAKGNLIIDANGLATITQSGGQEYLSTAKTGYQTVNYVDKIFECKGLQSISSIDDQPPKLSLLSLSSETIYKGQAVTVTFLATDNKELNSLIIYLIDPVGSVVDRYEGTALAKRVKGDANIGIYQVDLFARMISYEGKWKIWAMARDLNANVSAGIDLAFVTVKNSPSPSTTQLNEEEQLITIDTSTVVTISTSTEPKIAQTKNESTGTEAFGSKIPITSPPATSNIKTIVGDFGIKSTGTIAAIRKSVPQVVANVNERTEIVNILNKLDALSERNSNNKINLPRPSVVEVRYTSTTPKVCSVSGLSLLKKSQGSCIIEATTLASDRTTFVVQKKIVLKK